MPEDKFEITNWDKPLTGNFFGLSDIDLVYIFFEIEQEFCIRICPNMLEDYHLGTIRGICEVIHALL